MFAIPAAVSIITELFTSDGLLFRYLQELFALGGS
jgi:hypothetical protein